MPKSINEVKIAGHITEPKRSGRGPVRFSINTGGGTRKNGGNWPDEWHRFVCWVDKVPEATGLTKGQYVTVHGRLSYPAFDPQRDSLEDFVKWGRGTEIVASSIEVGEQKQVDRGYPPEPTDSDLPW